MKNIPDPIIVLFHKVMQLETKFDDKDLQGNNIEGTNRLFEEVCNTKNGLLRLFEDGKLSFANLDQKITYDWFMTFSERDKFKELLRIAHIIGKATRNKFLTLSENLPFVLINNNGFIEIIDTENYKDLLVMDLSVMGKEKTEIIELITTCFNSPENLLSICLPKDNEDMVENTHDINKAAIQDNNPVDIIIPIGVQRDDPRKNIYWTPCYQAKPLGNAHVIIVGQSGNGKSNLLKLLIKSISTSTDAPEKIVPSLVFDYHGELSGQGENGFLLGANANIVNPGMGIQINPLKLLEDPETKKKTSYLYSATMLGQTIGMAFELTNLQIGTLEMAIINVYKKAGFTENPETWELPVPPFKAIAEELEYMSVEERGVGFVLSKLRPLFINNIFRGDGRSGIEDLFTRTTVIRLNALPNLHLRSALVTLILIQLYEYMINQGPTRRLRCAVVADECHKLAKVPIFGDCYRELRKYGVSMIGASQRLTDFNPDILGNTATIIGMKMMADDSFRFAKELGTNNKRTAALLQRLGVGEAVIRNNAYYPFEVVKITRV